MEIRSRSQHSTAFHIIHSLFPFFILPFRRSSRLFQPSTWLCSLLLSTDTAQTAYSILSRRSPLFPPPSAFSSIVHVEMWVFRLPSSRLLVSFHVLSTSNLVLSTTFMM